MLRITEFFDLKYRVLMRNELTQVRFQSLSLPFKNLVSALLVLR